MDLAIHYFAIPENPIEKGSLSENPVGRVFLSENPPGKGSFSDSVPLSSNSPPRGCDVFQLMDSDLASVCGSVFHVMAAVMSSAVQEKDRGEMEQQVIKDCIRYTIIM